jgi:hypothetical protein
MFSKAKTDVERQRLFDEYMLSILKEREVIKKNKKIIEEKGFSYDPTINEDKMKGAFNTYVDSLVIKNFLIEKYIHDLKLIKLWRCNS